MTTVAVSEAAQADPEKIVSVAVIGSGPSGLSAALELSRHENVQVTLIEANDGKNKETAIGIRDDDTQYEVVTGSTEHDALGGHANSVPFVKKDGTIAWVDIGFVFSNKKGYEKFYEVMKELDIDFEPSKITFGITKDGQDNQLKPPINLNNNFGADYLIKKDLNNFVKDYIFKFKKIDPNTIDPSVTIRDYLNQNGFSEAFSQHYNYPIGAVLWLIGGEEIDKMPAQAFIQYMDDYDLRKLLRPTWNRVKEESRTYVSAVAEKIKMAGGEIITGLPISEIHRDQKDDQVRLVGAHKDGRQFNQTFDKVVMATPPAGSTAIIQDCTEIEKSILDSFEEKPVTIHIHDDTSIIPEKNEPLNFFKRVFVETAIKLGITGRLSQYFSANVNFKQDGSFGLTFFMNAINPQLGAKKGRGTDDDPMLVSINEDPNPNRIRATWETSHPIATAESIEAQKSMHLIQGEKGIYYGSARINGKGHHGAGWQNGFDAAQMLIGDLRKEERSTSPKNLTM